MRKITLLSCLAIAAFCFTDSELLAQPGGGRGGRGGGGGGMLERLMTMDKDGDKKLSKDEIPERMQRLLTEGDLDKDGMLGEEELKKLAAQRDGQGRGGRGGQAGGRGGEGGGRGGEAGGRGGRGGFGGGPGGGGPADYMKAMMQRMPVIAALDADKDGEISSTEIENAVAALKKLDKNGDGKISNEEMLPEGGFAGGRGGRGGFGGQEGGGRGGRGGGGQEGGGRGGRGGGGGGGGGDRPQRPARPE